MEKVNGLNKPLILCQLPAEEVSFILISPAIRGILNLLLLFLLPCSPRITHDTATTTTTTYTARNSIASTTSINQITICALDHQRSINGVSNSIHTRLIGFTHHRNKDGRKTPPSALGLPHKEQCNGFVCGWPMELQ